MRTKLRNPDWCLACILLVLFASGCKRNSLADLGVPEQLTLYSIDGRDLGQRGKHQDGEQFYGFPVLGKIEVTDMEDRREIITALKEGLAQSDVGMPKCFWPRHAIRAVEQGKSVDYVICFACTQLEKHIGDTMTRLAIAEEPPQQVFNRHLNASGIPIVPD